jgi:hypothetical protein
MNTHDQILLTCKSPSSIKEISDAVGLKPPNVIKADIDALVEEGALARTGKGRGTKYHSCDTSIESAARSLSDKWRSARDFCVDLYESSPGSGIVSAPIDIAAMLPSLVASGDIKAKWDQGLGAALYIGTRPELD